MLAAEPFRSIDGLFQTEIAARALDYALSRGWIDRLAAGPVAAEALPGMAGLNPNGRAFLLAELRAAGVLAAGEPVALADGFQALLSARDLLEARLWFLLAVASDLHARFPLFVESPSAFVQQAEVFRIFDYSRALTTSEADLAATARWVRYTTTLTRHEAPLLAPLLGVELSRQLLDVGGNSGEFALALAARNPGLAVSVVDLPGVCVLGARNVAGRPGAGQVSFVPRDLRSAGLPGPVDTIVFKSVLHDWPDDAVATFLAKARAALYPDGRLVIVERAPIPPSSEPTPFSALANLVFLPFFRPAATYGRLLADAGFAVERTAEAMLDMPFQLIFARRTG